MVGGQQSFVSDAITDSIDSSNMLYPKEDKTNSVLMFACQCCPYAEQAEATCIYRNSLKEEIAETAGNVEDVAQDPTVGDYESHDSAYDSAMEADMDLGDSVVPSMCTLCGQEITCPFCGQPTDGGVMLETTDAALETPQQQEKAVEDERRERTLSGAGLQLS